MGPRKTKPRSLIECLEEIPDPRVERTRVHRLIDIVVIAICTLICGGETFVDMEDFGEAREEWLKTFLELPGGIPSHDTFNRVFSAMDPRKFLESFQSWTQSLRTVIGQDIVSIDGKAVRRAIRKDKPLPYLVSAWAAENGLVLGQLQVDEKSNEITAVPELLQILDLKGCIVTIDAMGCQKKIAEQIQEAEADYALALKGNQGTAHEEIKTFLDDLVPQNAATSTSAPLPTHMDFLETIEKGHGRIETRRYWQSTAIDWFADRAQWVGLRSIGLVEATRETPNGVSYERRYYLSSLNLDVQTFARAVRQHWRIENSLHWVLDVVFREDDSRARTAHAAHNLGSLRRLALNMIKSIPFNKASIRSRRLVAAWSNAYLVKVLGI